MNKVVLLAAAFTVTATVASAVTQDDAPTTVTQVQPGVEAWLPLGLGALVIGAAIAGSDS